MKKTLTVLLIAATAMACRGRSSSVQRTQQQYDVVQEGQASGATGTVDAPGEVRPPVATQTNVDTTTNFTLPGGATATPAQGGSVATTLPSTGGAAPPMPSAPAPVPHGTARVQAPAAPTQPMTSAAAPPPPRETHRTNPPSNTDTTNTMAPTDTTAPTDTAKSPKDDKSKDEPKSPPTQTDTQAPPPTQTDTVGGHD